jgi:nitrous oxidase accessory protein NosD
VAVCRDAVVERNTIENSDLGILVTARNTGILLRENVFKNVKQETRDERAQQ